MKKIFRVVFCLISLLTLIVAADMQTAGAQRASGITKTFQEPGYGYSIALPADWVYDKQEGKTIVFSGPSGTKAWYSTVSIQNILSSKTGGKFNDIEDVVNDLKKPI